MCTWINLPIILKIVFRLLRKSSKSSKKRENHLNTISKMMGTLVHLQLYTFSYRKAVIWPQNMPKTADWGWNQSKLGYLKMAPQVQPKCFWHPKHMINNWQLKKKGASYTRPPESMGSLTSLAEQQLALLALQVQRRRGLNKKTMQ